MPASEAAGNPLGEPLSRLREWLTTLRLSALRLDVLILRLGGVLRILHPPDEFIRALRGPFAEHPQSPPPRTSLPIVTLVAIACMFISLALALAIWLVRKREEIAARKPAERVLVLRCSSYITNGVFDPVQGDVSRAEMIALYQSDVRAAPGVELPAHVLLEEQDPTDTGLVKLRVLQWNINGLMGTREGDGAVDALLMADTILATHSDVLLLQVRTGRVHVRVCVCVYMCDAE